MCAREFYIEVSGVFRLGANTRFGYYVVEAAATLCYPDSRVRRREGFPGKREGYHRHCISRRIGLARGSFNACALDVGVRMRTVNRQFE